jgi:hypothetical protein
LIEARVEEKLVREIEAIGGVVRKVRWLGRRGAPDRVVMLPGVLVWVELKAPGKVAEAHQNREHHTMKSMGQDIRVIDTIGRVTGFVNELKGRMTQ